jgi:hypothetical protein
LPLALLRSLKLANRLAFQLNGLLGALPLAILGTLLLARSLPI